MGGKLEPLNRRTTARCGILNIENIKIGSSRVFVGVWYGAWRSSGILQRSGMVPSGDLARAWKIGGGVW